MDLAVPELDLGFFSVERLLCNHSTPCPVGMQREQAGLPAGEEHG